MIHLDAHVAVWAHASRSRLSSSARRLLVQDSCQVSPVVLLEVEMLFELRRIAADATTILARLSEQIGLTVCETPFVHVVDAARTFAWTRDPFDRLIVANAMADGAPLLTADETILANFKDAVW
ncbi:MAG TPA: PIN domain-containing protein, partial [Caulobacteraceae bacterium]|nr:PIN domain-containing protein [Caulobacteraceae bacterium]